MYLEYETNRPVPGVGVPARKAPVQGYVLRRAEVSRQGLFYAGGIDLIYPITRRFQSYMGIGGGSGWWLPYGVTYEFDDEETEINESESELIEFDTMPFKGGFAIFHAGLAYRLGKKIQLGVETGVRQPIMQSQESFPGLWRVQTHLSYRF